MEENKTVIQEAPEAPKSGKEREFSPRAIIWGVVIGVVLLTAYMSMQIKTGIGIGLSPVSALLALVLLPLIGGKTGKKEVNIVQTIASAVTCGGAVAVTGIAALLMCGYEFKGVLFAVVILLSGIIGICMVAWFRKRTVEDKTLPFPQAIACKAVVDKAESSDKREMRILLLSILVGIVISALCNFGVIPPMVDFSAHLPAGMLLGIAFTPMLFGLGYMLGFKASLVLMAGGVVANLILSVIGTNAGWYPNPQTPEGAGAMQYFNLSLVVGIAMAGSLIPLCKPLIAKLRAPKAVKADAPVEGSAVRIPAKLVSTIGLVAVVLLVLFYKLFLGISPILTLIAVVCMIIIAYIDIRSMGETGMTVSGLFDLILLYVLGAIIQQPIITLFIITVAVSVMGLAGDTMTDLKTGAMIGASPRKQMWAQFIGLVPGAIMGVVFLYLMVNSWGIGTPEAPFPTASMFFGLSQSGAGGMAILNYGRMGIGAVVGAVIALFNLPAVAFGIALYLPIAYLVSIFIGGAIRGIVEKACGMEKAALWVNAASGIIISDGLVTLITMVIALF